MGDPARHTRIRDYRLRLTESGGNLQIESERFVPQHGSLLYPSDPKELLQAAMVAHNYGLETEFAQYFASPEVAGLFRSLAPAGGETGPMIEMAALEPRKVDGWCEPLTTPVYRPGADGTAPFAVNWGGMRLAYTWGVVTFGKTAGGLPVITGVKVTGECR